MVKSLPYGNLGNFNLRGKLAKALWAGKYIEDEIRNLKPSIVTRIHKQEMKHSYNDYNEMTPYDEIQDELDYLDFLNWKEYNKT